jgi:feruloyl-CoA synthase
MSGNAAAVLTKPAFRKIEWLKRDIAVERRPDGVIVLKSRIPLKAYEKHIPASLAKWASEAPSRIWLAQRTGAERQWRKVSYGEAKRTVDALTQALLNLGLEPGSPVAILSGNSIEHALMTQAAMQARFPAAPVSPAYSLMSHDHVKLRYLFDLIKPKVVMVQDGPAFEKALKALDLNGVTVVHVARLCEGIPSGAYADLTATPVTKEVEESIAAITPDTVGKLLFTSGSTGMPKAVINTQEMMCANAAMMMQVRPRDASATLPTVLDWMPWNHTMGGNAAFHPVLVDGGTLYIDDGRPMPGLFEETIRNLREVSPTYYANVPAGYAALAAAMEKDDALCRSFFRNLSLMAYGGARLPDDLYERMQALAVRATGERIVFYTGWGSTETAPTSTGTYWDTERVGLIGLPFPGVELKMVPVGAKYELRLRGVNVTPGYFGHRGGVRRRRFLLHRRRRRIRGPRRSRAGHHLRRPRRGRFQAHHRYLRSRRLAAHRCHRGGDAGGAGRAGSRAGPPLCRPVGVAQSARLPPDRRQSRRQLRGRGQTSRGAGLPEAGLAGA